MPAPDGSDAVFSRSFRGFRHAYVSAASRVMLAVAASLLAASICLAQAEAVTPLPKPYPLPSRFKARVEMFKLYDQAEPSVKGGIVFVGSSLITGWNKRLENDFPHTNVIARGFGGSTIRDQIAYMDITVLPHKPRQIVFSGGVDDFHAGRSKEGVLEDFKAFCERVAEALPQTKILYLTPVDKRPPYLGHKGDPSGALYLIQRYCESQPNLVYLETSNAFYKNFRTDESVFLKGHKMINDKGYTILADYIAEYLTPEPFPFANKADLQRAKDEKVRKQQNNSRRRQSSP